MNRYQKEAMLDWIFFNAIFKRDLDKFAEFKRKQKG